MVDFNQQFDYLDTLVDKPKVESCSNSCCSISENHVMDDSMIICKVCMNVVNNISSTPEWRLYQNVNGKDTTRCGMPVNVLLPESSIGSTVSFSKNDKTMNQIRKYQRWNSMPYKERSRYKVFTDIKGICSKNDIPKMIIDEASSLYTIISSTKISRGSNRKGIIAACVFYACKECNVPRSSKEIANMFDIDITVMTKGCKKCHEIMNLNKKNKNRLSNTSSIKPTDFILRFCNKLNITKEQTKIISKICDIAIKENIISENTPPSIAAGCIYFYCKQRDIDITKKDISMVCKISEVTINKCSKKIEQKKELFI